MQRRKHTTAGITSSINRQPASAIGYSAPDAAQHRGAEMQGAAVCSAAVVLLVIVCAAALLQHLQHHQQRHPHADAMHTHAESNRFAVGLQPPYFSVIFTSQRLTRVDELRYAAVAARMVGLATQQPGFLGVESARGPDGLGITVSYWATAADVAAWRRQLEHEQARDGGRGRWYSHYELRVARVERAYAWDAADGSRPPVAAQQEWLQQDTALSEGKGSAEADL